MIQKERAPMAAIAASVTQSATAALRRMYSAAAAAAPKSEPARLLVMNGKTSYSVEYLPDPLAQAHRRLFDDKRRFGAYIAERQRKYLMPLLFSAVGSEVGVVVLALLVALTVLR